MNDTTVFAPLMDLRDAWVEILGNDLVSLAAFGDIVYAERFQPDRNDIGLLLVLKQITAELLSKSADPLATARQKLQLHVLTLTVEELEQSCDVFPIKFRTMQRHHELLAGRDVLSPLNIVADHLRLRCEQELKNLMIRLRAQFLALQLKPGKNSRAFAVLMRSTRTPFLNALSTAVELKTGKHPSLRELPAEAATSLGIEENGVARLLELPSSASFEQSAEYLRIVEEAAHVVDAIQP